MVSTASTTTFVERDSPLTSALVGTPKLLMTTLHSTSAVSTNILQMFHTTRARSTSTTPPGGILNNLGSVFQISPFSSTHETTIHSTPSCVLSGVHV